MPRFTEEANAGKQDVDEEKADGGEEGEEEEEEEAGTDPRLSLQFSESLPLYTLPAHDLGGWGGQRDIVMVLKMKQHLFDLPTFHSGTFCY